MHRKKKENGEISRKLSRTQQKKDDRELQKLGERLVTLSSDQLDQLPLPQILAEAVKAAKSIRQHGARRRQMQYIGALMRQCDAELIRSRLKHLSRSAHDEVRYFKQVERWRDGLISGDDRLMEDILGTHKSLDRAELTALVQQARNEKERCASSQSTKRLFRYLSRAISIGSKN